jgi:hypothetical protein
MEETLKRMYFFKFEGKTMQKNDADIFKNIEIQLHKRLRRKWIIHSWIQAFDAIFEIINTSKSQEKKVIYISQVSLLDTHKSMFFQSLIDFWEVKVSQRKDIMLVLTSDSKAWTQKKLLNYKQIIDYKGFESIDYKPMTLYECEQLLIQKKIQFKRSDILNFYMVFGGIRSHWNKLVANKSISTQLNEFCFKDKSFTNKLQEELPLIFKKSELHNHLITTLSTQIEGLNRYEWLSKAKLSNGGGATRAIEDLINNGIVSKCTFYGRSNRDCLYYVSDYRILFQILFLSHKKKYSWTSVKKHTLYQTWQQQVFKMVCINHLLEVKTVLGISGIQTEESYWIKKNKKVSRSIDFILSRKDNIVHLFQFYFYTKEYKLKTDDFFKSMKAFQSILKTKKQCIPTAIYSSPSTIQAGAKLQKIELNIDDLFVQPIIKNKGYNFL